MEKPKLTKEEEQELVNGLLLVDQFCRTNDIDIEAVAEYLLNKKSPWIKISKKTMPKHSNFVRLGNTHGTIECYWEPSTKVWFDRKGYQSLKHSWTHWQEIELPKG